MKRKPVDMPAPTARLLKAAGLETHPPEVIVGLMCGSIAHIAAVIYEQWPEAWPAFARALDEAASGLTQVARSGNPRVALEAIVEAQRADTASGRGVRNLDALRTQPQ